MQFTRLAASSENIRSARSIRPLHRVSEIDLMRWMAFYLEIRILCCVIFCSVFRALETRDDPISPLKPYQLHPTRLLSLAFCETPATQIVHLRLLAQQSSSYLPSLGRSLSQRSKKRVLLPRLLKQEEAAFIVKPSCAEEQEMAVGAGLFNCFERLYLEQPFVAACIELFFLHMMLSDIRRKSMTQFRETRSCGVQGHIAQLNLPASWNVGVSCRAFSMTSTTPEYGSATNYASEILERVSEIRT